jgi:hypothetical protein
VDGKGWHNVHVKDDGTILKNGVVVKNGRSNQIQGSTKNQSIEATASGTDKRQNLNYVRVENTLFELVFTVTKPLISLLSKRNNHPAKLR